MKPKLILSTLIAAAGLLICGLFLTGCSSTPMAWEGKFYDITANVVPTVVVQTNQVFTTNVVERMVVATNFVAGVPQVNLMPVKEYTVTSDVLVTFKTNLDVTYTYTANTNSTANIQTAGNIANLIAPGSGGLVTTALGGLVAFWASIRSRKWKKTAGSLAQGIAVYGETVKATGAQGQKIDDQLKLWLRKHQRETGVVNEVLDLLARTVDKSDAKEAADAVRKLTTQPS